ncbi:hypothetical protein BDV59DRAFT_6164 [Aspergillus ambiguus]|uniref:ribosomal lysine N-methyltransferase n=1 Tax=Aspergillus ambiguus TaxID=176160 RepID=UPI003CCCE55E
MSSSFHFSDSPNFQRQSDDFISWLSEKPGVNINPNIAVTDLRSQGAGRGVVAQTDIPENEELFTIPRNLVLTTQNSKLKDLLSLDLEKELGPWMSLMLVMIYEYLLGDKSTWAAYFKVLPHTFDTLMFWSDDELLELQESPVVDNIGRQDADDTIRSMIAPIMRKHPSLFPPVDGLPSYDGDAGAQAVLHLAHRMGSLIMAYAFDIEKPEDEDEEGDGEGGYMTDDEEEQLPKGMVPLADLLNADADRNNARLFQDGNALVMKAIKPIAKGEEIFNDYGEIPRADLLRRYGYVTDNYAPYDVVELSLETICKVAGLSDADTEEQPPLAFLEEFDAVEEGYVLPRPSQEDDSLAEFIPTELKVLLRTLTLSPEELAQQKSQNKPPKPAFEQAEATILAKAIQLRLSNYDTTIAEDQEILAQLNSSEDSSGPLDQSARRRRMAVQVRIGEKEVFQQLASILDAYVNAPAAKRAADGDNGESRASKAPRT